MIDIEKPPLGGVYLAHVGVKGMRWGHRKGFTQEQKTKAKAAAIVGAALVGSALHASGKLGVTTSYVARKSLKGAFFVTEQALTMVGNVVGIPIKAILM